mgnify:FL=1|tara:strand:- start:4257 stop:4571 length:315 start_codon:yes stop_codon:yes gene_type:complete
MVAIFSTHPMYSLDRPIVDAITDKSLKELSKQDIVDLARLYTRYSGYPGGDNIKDIIVKYLDDHGKTFNDLQIKSREIWQSGWRPHQLGTDEVGSGADVEAGAV